jgi:hypothetical protein
VTIAVAAAYPWLPGWPADDYGVVMATDSRFVYGDGRVDDAGRKIMAIDWDAAFAFAGDVRSAEKAASSVEKLLERRKARTKERPMRGDPTAAVAAAIDRAYDHERRRVRKPGERERGLYVLLGIWTPTEPRILAITSKSGFKPRWPSPVAAVGDEGACISFLEKLAERRHERLLTGNLPRRWEDWQFDVFWSVSKTIAEDTSGCVGGHVQSVVVRKGEVREMLFSSTRAPLDLSAWQQRSQSILTANPLDRSR